MKEIFIAFTIILFTGLFRISLATPPDMVVAPDGSGDFTSIQKAIDAVPSNSDRTTIILIKRGLYNTEKLIIPADKKNVIFLGESREETIISYHIYDCASGKCPPEDAAKWTGDNIRTSATLTIMGDGFRAENLTIQNTAGPLGQAQAVTVQADKVVFVNCDLKGYQDTMYLWSSGKRSFFDNCLIIGRTDYIYGGGIAFFNRCEIRSWGGGWITAPSTPKSQAYGFVFSDCKITYATNSPRAGDDGNKFRFGRPWNDYPKVTWLFCDITGMLNPQGWGDTWNMSYAATSTDLHLYEYKNTGAGADMSGRANWAGLRALTDAEALNYTIQKVMAGSDNWDPYAQAPMVQQYTWIGKGAGNNWLTAGNWSPAAIPASGEGATVTGNFMVKATGNFPADLYLTDSARLEVSGTAAAAYLSAKGTRILSSGIDTLSGKIAVKDSIAFDISGQLTVKANLTGIHPLIKTGTGHLILSGNNSNFSGKTEIRSGTLEASAANALGKGPVEVKSKARLVIGDAAAFFAKARLTVAADATLELKKDMTTSEFYIGTTIQPVGEYSAATNPGLISGTGKVIVGRPSVFTFTGATNGNWDVATNFSPALLPEAGETVTCEREMETTSTVFAADLILRGAGRLRLRGNHQATGTITMEQGTVFSYNTSGTGMALNAPVKVMGNVEMIMESASTTGSSMKLEGPVSGNTMITPLNNGRGTINTGTLVLTGNNSNFTGTWNLTKYTTKYPTVTGYHTRIEGAGEYAFGASTIDAGLKSKVIISHARAAWPKLTLNLKDSARLVLNVPAIVSTCVLNGQTVPDGIYSASTHPLLYEGTGSLTVGSGTGQTLPAFPGAEGHGKYTTGGRGGRVIYVTNLSDDSNPGSLRYAISQSGPRIILFRVSGTIRLTKKLSISNGNVTIAGQTAPGDGITIRDYPVEVSADNVIIRFMRFRTGDVTNQEADALGGRFRKNIIVDHCSMSWSVDECVSFYVNENFTLQWCLISESLRNSVHGKGAHGYGGIWGGKNASFHHNLLAHHDSRNPRLGESNGDAFALTDLVDLRNNVIYNWVGNSCYGGEAMNVNIVNCYYKPGPGTTKKERIISIDKETETGFPTTGKWGKFFIDGNYLPASSRATNDNWTYGVYNQFHSSYGTVPEADRIAMRMPVPHNPGEVTTHTAENAYEKILLYSGASLVRDTIDRRIIKDVTTGTATYMSGGNGSVNGIIDTQSAVGGWPELASLPAPADSDSDGMSDAWEDANGLDKNSPADAQATTVDGKYPNVEVYINSLVASITDNQLKDAITTSARITQKGSDRLTLYQPTQGLLKIEHGIKMSTVTIFSLTGAVMKNLKCNHSTVETDISGLKPGLYLVRAMDVDRKIHSSKFIKN